MGAEYIIWRGRFQPFTKIHFECIKGLYQTYIAASDGEFAGRDVPWLVLCVIRDYEALGARYGIQSNGGAASDSTPRSETFFRHLLMFNPLSLSECIISIKEGVWHFFEKENREWEHYTKFRDFLMCKLVIVSAPLNFQHLIEFNSGGFWHESDRNDDRELKLIYALANEALSFEREKSNLFWFLPIFDEEDLKDFWYLLKDKKYSKKNILGCFHPEISDRNSDIFFTTSFNDRSSLGRISFYGAFVYYAYLEMYLRTSGVEEYRSTRSKDDISQDALEAEKDKTRKFLKRIASDQTQEWFDAQMKETIPPEKDTPAWNLLKTYTNFQDQAKHHIKLIDRDDLEAGKKRGATWRELNIGDRNASFENIDLDSIQEKLATWLDKSGSSGDRNVKINKWINVCKKLQEKRKGDHHYVSQAQLDVLGKLDAADSFANIHDLNPDLFGSI